MIWKLNPPGFRPTASLGMHHRVRVPVQPPRRTRTPPPCAASQATSRFVAATRLDLASAQTSRSYRLRPLPAASLMTTARIAHVTAEATTPRIGPQMIARIMPAATPYSEPDAPPMIPTIPPIPTIAPMAAHAIHDHLNARAGVNASMLSNRPLPRRS
jgi:hypothetical protein